MLDPRRGSHLGQRCVNSGGLNGARHSGVDLLGHPGIDFPGHPDLDFLGHPDLDSSRVLRSMTVSLLPGPAQASTLPASAASTVQAKVSRAGSWARWVCTGTAMGKLYSH